MKVRSLSVGPIIGAASAEAVRIFGRADVSRVDDGSLQRCHGVIQFRREGQTRYTDPIYFKMNPNFDMTGVAILTGLSAGHRYEYRMGWLVSEVDSEEINVDDVLEWEEVKSASFAVHSRSPGEQRSFVFGSCRYLLKLFGGSWFDDRGDKAFRSIFRQIEKQIQTDQLIMVGDQIYADDLNFLSPDSCIDEFNKRYRDVFQQEHISKLMSHVPTFMTLDDHEIENDWPKSANPRDWQVKFPAAMHAYTTYQLSHSPLFELSGNRLSGVPNRYWYNYQDGCSRFFVMDVRTERDLDSAPNRIVSEHQMDAVKDWLNQAGSRVSFIISSVPIFPDYQDPSDDKWSGFIQQRDELLEHIFDNNIKRVVFLSGDVHASMAAELSPVDDTEKKIISIVSSSFFWPYPHPKPRSFQRSGFLNSLNQYRVRNATSVWADDSFARVTVDPSELRVQFFERKGDQLGSKRFTFSDA